MKYWYCPRCVREVGDGEQLQTPRRDQAIENAGDSAEEQYAAVWECAGALERELSALRARLEAPVPEVEENLHHGTLENSFDVSRPRQGPWIHADLARSLALRLREAEAPHWTCYRCGEKFTDKKLAADHFGPDEEFTEPGCVARLTDSEKELRAQVVDQYQECVGAQDACYKAEQRAETAERALEAWQHATNCTSADTCRTLLGKLNGDLAAAQTALADEKKLSAAISRDCNNTALERNELRGALAQAREDAGRIEAAWVYAYTSLGADDATAVKMVKAEVRAAVNAGAVK